MRAATSNGIVYWPHKNGNPVQMFGEFEYAAAYVLYPQLRELGLQNTVLANAQPKTVILSLFKIAVRIKPYKERVSAYFLPSQITTGICLPATRPAQQEICHAGFGHDRVRLAHETVPPTLNHN